jgi:diguanylate cyclase (GGDEF)-like protein
VSRWPAIFMLFAHGALFLLRTPLNAILPWSANSHGFESVWMTVLSFEALLFTIAIAFILLAMAKERTELLHKTASLVDPLTGIPNRPRIHGNGDSRGSSARIQHQAGGVLLIDLDHFKQINDAFGHGVGRSACCRSFAETRGERTSRPEASSHGWAARNSRVLLDDCDAQKAVAVAERIRADFAMFAAEVDGCAVNGTVSVGVALCEQGPLGCIRRARASGPGALSTPSSVGRNRVETCVRRSRVAAGFQYALAAHRRARLGARGVIFTTSLSRPVRMRGIRH